MFFSIGEHFYFVITVLLPLIAEDGMFDVMRFSYWVELTVLIHPLLGGGAGKLYAIDECSLIFF